MGGLNAFRYVVDKKPKHLSGALIVAPAFGLDDPPNSAVIFMGTAFSYVLPWLTVDNELNPNDISRIPEEVERYKSDPMIHRRISLQTAAVMLSYQKALKRVKEIHFDIPILLCHGTSDKMTSPSSCKMVFEKITCADKTLKLYENAYHSLHYDECRNEVLKDWSDWLLKHIQLNK